MTKQTVQLLILKEKSIQPVLLFQLILIPFIADSLWTAPEHIFNEQFPRSQPGDVYSYGIMLSEIVTRGLPYSMFEDLSAKCMCLN